MSELSANDRRNLLRDAVRAVDEMKGRLEALERARTEPIAIIGIGCRYPGADGPDAFWHLLENGGDAVTEVPASRWTADAYSEIDAVTASGMPVQRGGFLPQVDQFDPQFFGISPREAVSIDPQQRLVLEVSWEALEHACVSPEALRDSADGCVSRHNEQRLLALPVECRAGRGRRVRRDGQLPQRCSRASRVHAGLARTRASPSTRRVRRRSSPFIWRVRACGRATATSRSPEA